MPEIEYIKDDKMGSEIFPAVGHTYEVDYGGDFLVRLEFQSVSSLTVYGLKGKYAGFVENVAIMVTPIRPGVFMVAWQEENKTTVAHVEDFEKGIIYANITQPGNSFLRLQGPFKLVK